MSFREKSAWVMFLAMGLVYGGYGWRLMQGGDWAAGGTGTLVGVVIAFIAVAVVGHIIVAAFAPRQADQTDERDARISLYADRAGGHALGAIALAALAFALINEEWMLANLVFLGLAGAELVRLLWKIALYRLGA